MQLTATATAEQGPWTLPARMIRPGDVIRLDDGSTSKVTDVIGEGEGPGYVGVVEIATSRVRFTRAPWAPVEITEPF